MSNKATDKPTSTTTPTNWFANIGGQFLQLTGAAFNAIIGALIGTQTHAASAKTTLADADELPLSDSAASNATKRITWANLWLAIKAKGDVVYAALVHNHSAADLTSGTVPDARFPSTLPALNGSALTNLNAAALTTGTIDVARIPLLYSGVQVVSSGAIADLTSPQQATVTGGAIVTTTDGRRWIYKGSGGKTTEASYIETADVTPEWSVIANKPSTFAPSAHAASHKSGGADAIKLDELAAPTDVTTLNATTSAHGLLPKLGGGTTNFLRADGSWAAPAGGGGSALARGYGTLQGHTTAGAAATSPSQLNYNFGIMSWPHVSGSVTLTYDATTYTIYLQDTDPFAGDAWVDTTSFSIAADLASGLASAINTLIGSTVAAAAYDSCLVDNPGTGTSAILGGTASYSDLGSIGGGGSGTDATSDSGAVQEVVLIAQSGVKSVLPVKISVFGDGALSGVTVEVALKVGGSYYPVAALINGTLTYGDAIPANHWDEWVIPRISSALVARYVDTPPMGGVMTLFAIAEQN